MGRKDVERRHNQAQDIPPDDHLTFLDDSQTIVVDFTFSLNITP